MAYFLGTSIPEKKKITVALTQSYGIGKEKSIIVELLKEITYPIVQNTYELADELFENHGFEVNLNLWPKVAPSRLYVNESFQKGYGYIQLSNLHILLIFQEDHNHSLKRVLIHVFYEVHLMTDLNNLMGLVHEEVFLQCIQQFYIL